jgi:mono/diheme cytochrome c family protein
MKYLIISATLAAVLSGCQKADQKTPAAGGPPPMPEYVIRGDAPPGDRLAAGRDGEKLFRNRCGTCHLAGGMGTNVLTVQMLMAKRPPEQGLLENRDDLAPDYVEAVVRNGKMAMPRQTRVDVTDAELDSIAAYLGKAKK